MKVTPFKYEKSDVAWYFDLYYFHCVDCGAEYRSHRWDNRTQPYCSECRRKYERERAIKAKKESEERKEKFIRNKAIDDFMCRIQSNNSIADFMKEYLQEIAEELKS